MKRIIGVHVRLTNTLAGVVQMAQRIGANSVQSFLIHQVTGHYISPSKDEIREFLIIKESLNTFYIHSSYWINIARIGDSYHDYLDYECIMAERLQCAYIVMHPGTTKGSSNRLDGIDAAVRTLNQLNKKYKTLTIVLENTAYAGMSIGSDLHDFALMRSKLDNPEKVLYCIDTAHAHAYGYDIVSIQGLHDFVLLLDNTIGIHNICLIHLNDTIVAQGSYVDRHHIIGQGAIGLDALKRFATHSLLSSIPLLLELPVLEESEIKKIVNEVQLWSAQDK